MANKLQLKIITPERLVLEEKVDFVVIPTTEGEITVLPDHVPLIAQMSSGDIIASGDGEQIPFAVVGGFIEIKKEDGITTCAILADFAETIAELTEDKVMQARAHAEELKKQMENKEVVDFEHFASELERSLTRVKIADKWKSKKYRR